MRCITFFAGLFLAALTAEAQDTVTASTYWVIETNVNDRSYSILKLYDQNNQLVHEVKIEGVSIDIRQARQRKILNQILKNYNGRATVRLKRIKPRRLV